MNKLKFEESLKRLNEIVELLKKNDVEIENALTLFKEGKEILKNLGDSLENIDKQISELIVENN